MLMVTKKLFASRCFLLLTLFIQIPLAISGGNSNLNQSPIRAFEYRPSSDNPNQGQNNSPTTHQCAPNQCPEQTKQPRQPVKTTPPSTLKPQANTPQSNQPIPMQPTRRFATPLPTESQPYEPKQLLLFFADPAIANTRVQTIRATLKLTPSERTQLKTIGGELVVYDIQQNDLTNLKKELAMTAPEAIVEYNFYYQSLNGPRQYFQQKIKLPKPPSTSNHKTAIGIVDTAVAKTPALAHVNITQKRFIPTSNKPSTATHGTSIALLIAGKDNQHHFYGVSPNSPLYVADIMRKVNQRNNTNSKLLAQALDWLISQQVKVINLSLGGPKDAIMSAIFRQLSKQPVIIVAAAGNSGPKAPPSYPAAYPNVIAVSATNANNAIYRYANRGNYIDLVAPGEDVWVPVSNSGQYVSGTSFSAALVSGVVSQLLASNTKTNTQQAKQSLCKHAIDLGATGPDDQFGCGLLQHFNPEY